MNLEPFGNSRYKMTWCKGKPLKQVEMLGWYLNYTGISADKLDEKRALQCDQRPRFKSISGKCRVSQKEEAAGLYQFRDSAMKAR